MKKEKRNTTTGPQNVFVPFVTAEHVVAFEKDKPETHTLSPFINALILAFGERGFCDIRTMSAYLGVSTREISAICRVEAGMTFGDIRTCVLIKRFWQIKKEHPTWVSDQIAHHLGMSGRGALWNIVHDKKNIGVVNLVDPKILKMKRELGARNMSKKRMTEIIEKLIEEGKINISEYDT